MRGLYIHIPFCKSICSYCDFPKKIRLNDEQVKIYLDHLEQEILKYKDYFNSIDTIYIGGGTPNNLNDYNLERLLSFIKSLNITHKEYTIECNLELITKKQVKLFKQYGINRISLGVQTFNDRLLKILNRHHNKEDVINTVNLLKNEGINNINIDLIFGIFTESFDEFKEDLDTYLSLDLPHLSYYSLILEDKTLLSKTYTSDDFDDDEIAKMYEYLIDNMCNFGYNHYEISNYAKKGYESLHNIKYWQKQEYIGVGMGATSYLNSMRITNNCFINKYIREEDKTIEKLSLDDEKVEYVMLGLRMTKGVDLNNYYNKYHSYLDNDYDISKILKYNLVIIEDNHLRLTKKGLMLANAVFEVFI